MVHGQRIEALLALYRALVSGAPRPLMDESLAETAAEHRLAPHVYAEFRRRGISLPALWKSYFKAQLGLHARFMQRFFEVSGALRDMPVIAWKGLDTAFRLYPDPGERAMNDHDILLRENDFDEAVRRLQKLGFAVVPGSRKGVARAPEHYAAQLFRDGYSIDVHRAARQKARALIDYDAIFKRATSAPSGILHMHPEDALLLHAYHIAAHEMMVPLIAYVELERWLGLCSPAWDQARAWGIWRPLVASLWTGRRLGAEMARAPFAAARFLPSPERIALGHPHSRSAQLVRKFFLIDRMQERLAFLVYAASAGLRKDRSQTSKVRSSHRR